MTIEFVINEYAEDASFLWLLRDAATNRPDYSLKDLAQLDERVEAHLDGLITSGVDGWTRCAASLGDGEAGEVFAAAFIALEGEDGGRLERVLDTAMKSKDKFRGLLSAIGWISQGAADRWISGLLDRSTIQGRAAALAGLSIRRGDISSHIGSALHQDKLLVNGRVLRAVGDLKLRETLRELQTHYNSVSEACRFWAARSGALLGDNTGVEILRGFAGSDSDFALRAMWIVPRVLQKASAEQWLRGLAQSENSRRLAIVGCGIAGDPVYVPRLLGIIAKPAYARVAGEAISMITGIDLAYEDLDGDWPEGFEAGPTEDPEDENVDLDEDEDLPWPDQALVQKWWDANGGQFQQGRRYLCGQPITDENCRRVLREGYQRQRIAAAYELALMNPDEPLFEWRAPGFKQQEWLGIKRR